MRKKTEENTRSGKEIESLIVDLAKQGLTPEKIGQKLKEENKIKARDFGIKIGKMLREHNLYTDPDIKNLTTRTEKLKKHLEKNKHDNKTKRILLIKEAKLRKLRNYKKRV